MCRGQGRHTDERYDDERLPEAVFRGRDAVMHEGLRREGEREGQVPPLITFIVVLNRTPACADALYLDGVVSGLWADGFPCDHQVQKYAGFLAVMTPIAAP